MDYETYKQMIDRDRNISMLICVVSSIVTAFCLQCWLISLGCKPGNKVQPNTNEEKRPLLPTFEPMPSVSVYNADDKQTGLAVPTRVMTINEQPKRIKSPMEGGLTKYESAASQTDF